MEFCSMTTETRNGNTMELDSMSSLEIVKAMNQEDATVPLAVSAVLPQIAQLVDYIEEAFRAGGRLFYIGAGTSGRLGILDAVECPPTFGVSEKMVIGLIAGGRKALFQAVEGAEDSQQLAEEDLKEKKLNEKDIVVGIAASGRTPYVIGGLRYAASLGCMTASICCNRNCDVSREAKLAIEVEVGPEILTGSTRLKAGTAQKMILNMISTAAMVRSGKAYQNLMVDVQMTNEKLHERAERIVTDAAGVTRSQARTAIAEADGNVKCAITMLLAGCSMQEATSRLEAAKGHIRRAICIQEEVKG